MCTPHVRLRRLDDAYEVWGQLKGEIEDIENENIVNGDCDTGYQRVGLFLNMFYKGLQENGLVIAIK